LRNQAAQVGDDLARWEKARDAAHAVERLLADARDEHTRHRVAVLVKAVTAEARTAQNDQKLLDYLIDIRAARADDREGSATDANYASAFREVGLDMTALPPDEAGAKIRARPARVAAALAAALDDWASVRRDVVHNRPGAEKLAQVARAADPDPWRDGLRTALDLGVGLERLAALRVMARGAKNDELAPVSLNLLGSALLDAEDVQAAEGVLRQAQRRYPGDVWLNYRLAACLEKLARREEAIRYYTAARSIRAETAHELAHALQRKGEFDEAIAIFRDLERLRPEDSRHHVCLAGVLRDRGRSTEAAGVLEAAVAVLRDASRSRPLDGMIHVELSKVLKAQNKPDEGIAELRIALRLRPDADAHVNLGQALYEQLKLEEAIAEYRAAGRLEPDSHRVHHDLGAALKAQGRLEDAIAELCAAVRTDPNCNMARHVLYEALERHGKLEEGIAVYKEVIRLRPADPEARTALGKFLGSHGKLEEGIAVYKEAIRLRPGDPGVHVVLGRFLGSHGKLEEAIAEYKEAIRLRPDASSHDELGHFLGSHGKVEEAVAEYKEAIGLDPNLWFVHSGLGDVLTSQGKLVEAMVEYRNAFRLMSDGASRHNILAWWVALSPARPRRDYDEALEHARKAVELAPKDGRYVNTLALAEYRAGHWNESISASERSMALQNGGDASDWFFLALAHSRKDEKDDAGKWFDKAVAWTTEKDPKNAELRQFWKEAAVLLGQPGPNASGTSSPVAPAVEKPH
jgi:tetratricopeptide (TPR) repeat protein